METKLKIIDVLDKNKKGIHIREIARVVKTSYNNTVRNLKILEKEKVIKKENEANLVKISLKNNPLTIAYLKQINTKKFLLLPQKIWNALIEFLDELNEKPLVALIFGSYAKGNYMSSSDVDLLLIFQEVKKIKVIENTAKRISMRTNTKLNVIYVDYCEFENNMKNKDHSYSNEIKNNAIIIKGTEDYYPLVWKSL